MNKIISCVPNICEGKDQKFIDDLVQKLKTVKDLTVLDVSRDSVRNRTVFSFTGTQEALFEGGMLLYRETLAHVDMREHHGEYPRLGSVDVFPFRAAQGRHHRGDRGRCRRAFAHEGGRGVQDPGLSLRRVGALPHCAAMSRTSARANTRAWRTS